MLRRSRALLALLAVLAPLSPAWATDYDVVNEDIWPSQNDVAQTAGNGKKLLENQWQEVMGATYANNVIYAGCALPASSGTLNISVPACQALIKGRFIDIPGSTTITATASSTNHVFLKFTRDGSSLATGAKFEVNTSGTAPADSTKLATMVASGTAITSTTDARLVGPHGVIVLTSGTSWIVPAGLTRIEVEVFGASGGGGGGGEGETSTSTSGNDGGAGGAGGATTFNVLTTTGGAAGGAGQGGSTGAAGAAGAANGVGSGGTINFTGRGQSGGRGGGGGGSAGTATSNGLRGGTGGDGGYSAGYLPVTPGTTLSYGIGAAGSAGAGGAGAGNGGDGGAGIVGQAGMIVIRY